MKFDFKPLFIRFGYKYIYMMFFAALVVRVCIMTFPSCKEFANHVSVIL
jgi:hypothetical protein